MLNAHLMREFTRKHVKCKHQIVTNYYLENLLTASTPRAQSEHGVPLELGLLTNGHKFENPTLANRLGNQQKVARHLHATNFAKYTQNLTILLVKALSCKGPIGAGCTFYHNTLRTYHTANKFLESHIFSEIRPYINNIVYGRF